ncbi:GNAT family N-acetyltransferase [Amaricoccus solimangrovi]|uniref:N-acetyltransferase n=1 Tax=Amaricoccus solimangrovi TaxID=2589815 RepID=A0A501WTS5_9RHOB|nr:GNAT family N-acetyltransferase [Amaricoccus solimangrovi]TPE49236.1 N-acetyltransferase [Amaricoccus solimangrovi]
MDEITITLEETDARHGRYVARVAGIAAEAEIIFTRRGPGRVSADHTGVPEAMGGRGVGKALIEFMLADARARGLRIIPLCPFIRGQYARHPEWADVFTTAPGEEPEA